MTRVRDIGAKTEMHIVSASAGGPRATTDVLDSLSLRGAAEAIQLIKNIATLLTGLRGRRRSLTMTIVARHRHLGLVIRCLTLCNSAVSIIHANVICVGPACAVESGSI